MFYFDEKKLSYFDENKAMTRQCYLTIVQSDFLFKFRIINSNMEFIRS